MVAVAVGRVANEAADDDIRTQCANYADQIGQCGFAAIPLLNRLFRGAREAEVGDATEALVGAVIAVGFEEFERAQHAEFVAEFLADGVLSAFTAGEGHLDDVSAASAGFEREHAAVFIVGMGGGVHQARGGAKLAQREQQAGLALINGKGFAGVCNGYGGDDENEGEKATGSEVRH